MVQLDDGYDSIVFREVLEESPEVFRRAVDYFIPPMKPQQPL